MSEDLFRRRLTEAAGVVETELDALLGLEAGIGEIARPARLIEAMRWGALGGGKRLRPFLTLETARALGTTGAAPARAGVAIECVHGYSLIHDDLPAMDDDDLRRGRPTVHIQFDEATAILAGDALLTLAFEIVADPATHAEAEVRAELCLGLARASGLGGMVGGQMYDIAAESAATPLLPAEIVRLQAMKTGALLQFSVDAGAIVARAPPRQRAALSAYGRALGAAFQIADDILDAEGATADLGKRAGKDAGRNKGTFVGVHGIEEAKRLRDERVEQALVALDAAELGENGEILREGARFAAERRN